MSNNKISFLNILDKINTQARNNSIAPCNILLLKSFLFNIFFLHQSKADQPVCSTLHSYIIYNLYSWFLDMGAWFLDMDAWFLDMDAWFLGMEAWFLDMVVWCHDMDAWFLDMDAWFLDMDAWFLDMDA